SATSVKNYCYAKRQFRTFTIRNILSVSPIRRGAWLMKPNKLTPGHNVMWECSRMMLPEHVEAILEWQKGLEKVKKPIIDEQQWTEFAHIIQEAKACKRRIKITIWKDGIFDEIVGWVHN